MQVIAALYIEDYRVYADAEIFTGSAWEHPVYLGKDKKLMEYVIHGMMYLEDVLKQYQEPLDIGG